MAQSGCDDLLGNMVLLGPNHHRLIHALDAPLNFGAFGRALDAEHKGAPQLGVGERVACLGVLPRAVGQLERKHSVANQP